MDATAVGTDADQESFEGGALLPVLRRASHADLAEIAEAIDKSWDVFLTRDGRYAGSKDDLTRIPEVIAEHLLRAGGHSLCNFVRGGGPGYAEVVRDVCGAVGAKVEKDETDVVGMEAAFLLTLMEKALKGMTAPEKDDMLRRMKAAAGRPVAFADMVKGSALLGLLMPLVLMAVAQQTLAKGLTAAAQALLGRLAASVAGPVGLVAGTLWLASDAVGPSYRATIPAVAQVALLRQRMLYE